MRYRLPDSFKHHCSTETANMPSTETANMPDLRKFHTLLEPYLFDYVYDSFKHHCSTETANMPDLRKFHTLLENTFDYSLIQASLLY
jgi:hypothetical protein